MEKTIYSKEHKALIQKLIRARNDAGFDQMEAAKRLKRTQSYISKIETGQRRVDVVQLKEFAKLYGKPMSYFIEG